MIRFPFSPEII